MNEHLLIAFFVFETDLVKARHPLALAASGFDPALGFVIGQLVGRHLAGVIDAADDDGLVGVAFEKIDDDFLADTRKKDHAPPFACPVLGNPNPAGAVLIPFSFAVPVKLHFDPAILVGKDLFTCRTHNDGGLRPLDDGFRESIVAAGKGQLRDAGKLLL